MCTNNLRVEHVFPTVRDDGLLLPANLLLPAVQDEGLLLPAVQDRSVTFADHAVPTDQFALPDPYAFELVV
jgi:hypothetical protein